MWIINIPPSSAEILEWKNYILKSGFHIAKSHIWHHEENVENNLEKIKITKELPLWEDFTWYSSLWGRPVSQSSTPRTSPPPSPAGLAPAWPPPFSNTLPASWPVRRRARRDRPWQGSLSVGSSPDGARVWWGRPQPLCCDQDTPEARRPRLHLL